MLFLMCLENNVAATQDGGHIGRKWSGCWIAGLPVACAFALTRVRRRAWCGRGEGGRVVTWRRWPQTGLAHFSAPGYVVSV